MKKLYDLISKCKCGVYVHINPHRDTYKSVTEWIEDLFSMDLESEPEIPSEIINKMIADNIIIKIQFYPDTPLGFYRVFHYDLECAINLALACLDNK